MQIRTLLEQSQGQTNTYIFVLPMDVNELDMLPKVEARNSTISG